MNFDQSDWIVTILMVVLGISVLVAVFVIIKSFASDAKENKARATRLAEEESTNNALQEAAQTFSKPKAETKAKKKPKPNKPTPHKDDVNEDDDLVAAAEVYLTYELVEQAITSLEKHLLQNPTDKKALALLKKAEASQ